MALATNRPWPTDKAYLGIAVGDAHLADLERKLGFRHIFFREYRTADTSKNLLDGTYIKNETSKGRICILSFKPPKGMKWRQVADGQLDGWLRRQFEQIAAWGQRIVLSFHHEPEGKDDAAEYGTGLNTMVSNALAYVEAFRQCVKIQREVRDATGVRNVRWIWCPVGWSYADYIARMYPGNDVVYYIGSDPYDGKLGSIGPGSFGGKTRDDIAFSKAHGKQHIFCETGVAAAHSTQHRYDFFMGQSESIRTTFTANPNLKGVVYFSEDFRHAGHDDWRLDAGDPDGALKGWQDLAHLDRFDVL